MPFYIVSTVLQVNIPPPVSPCGLSETIDTTSTWVGNVELGKSEHLT